MKLTSLASLLAAITLASACSDKVYRNDYTGDWQDFGGRPKVDAVKPDLGPLPAGGSGRLAFAVTDGGAVIPNATLWVSGGLTGDRWGDFSFECKGALVRDKVEGGTEQLLRMKAPSCKEPRSGCTLQPGAPIELVRNGGGNYDVAVALAPANPGDEACKSTPTVVASTAISPPMKR